MTLSLLNQELKRSQQSLGVKMFTIYIPDMARNLQLTHHPAVSRVYFISLLEKGCVFDLQSSSVHCFSRALTAIQQSHP